MCTIVEGTGAKQVKKKSVADLFKNTPELLMISGCVNWILQYNNQKKGGFCSWSLFPAASMKSLESV